MPTEVFIQSDNKCLWFVVFSLLALNVIIHMVMFLSTILLFSTYQKVLRQLTGINNEPLEYCRDLLENPADLWIEDIIKNDYIECNDYIENNYTEDEDDYEYDYLD